MSLPSRQRRVITPSAPPPKVKAKDLAPSQVYIDFNRKTCIEVLRAEGTVSYIPFETDDLIAIHEDTARSFDKRFKMLDGYPVERAAKLYLAYAANLGITRDALARLSHFAQIKEGEFVMAAATTKKEAPVKKVAAKPEPLVPKAKKEVAAPTPPAKPAKAEPAKKDAPAAKAPRVSAAQRFKDLIMEGKLTDKQIFLKVQGEFNLDDAKSGYVAWYRNWLKKNTPGPVPEQKKDK